MKASIKNKSQKQVPTLLMVVIYLGASLLVMACSPRKKNTTVKRATQVETSIRTAQKTALRTVGVNSNGREYTFLTNQMDQHPVRTLMDMHVTEASEAEIAKSQNLQKRLSWIYVMENKGALSLRFMEAATSLEMEKTEAADGTDLPEVPEGNNAGKEMKAKEYVIALDNKAGVVTGLEKKFSVSGSCMTQACDILRLTITENASGAAIPVAATVHDMDIKISPESRLLSDAKMKTKEGRPVNPVARVFENSTRRVLINTINILTGQSLVWGRVERLIPVDELDLPQGFVEFRSSLELNPKSLAAKWSPLVISSDLDDEIRGRLAGFNGEGLLHLDIYLKGDDGKGDSSFNLRRGSQEVKPTPASRIRNRLLLDIQAKGARAHIGAEVR